MRHTYRARLNDEVTGNQVFSGLLSLAESPAELESLLLWEVEEIAQEALWEQHGLDASVTIDSMKEAAL